VSAAVHPRPRLLAPLALLAAAALVSAPAGRASPPSGRDLYEQGCARCHGGRGEGIRSSAGPHAVIGRHLQGPPLVGVGAQAADFYVRTGYMPLQDARSQPRRKRPRFTEPEIRALVRFVASLGNGPPRPTPHPERGSLSEGMQLFTQNCAGCHQMVGQGGVVTGAVAPDLKDATPTQIAEAVRIGPYLMPRFSPRQISARELDSIVRYVQYVKHPADRGGWAIGHLGPFPEGMITWLVAAVVLVGVATVIGKRLT
jgi:ubiquinol-cytochrome c reductase cytochrome c subunit